MYRILIYTCVCVCVKCLCRSVAASHISYIPQIPGLPPHSWYGDQAIVHDLEGKKTHTPHRHTHSWDLLYGTAKWQYCRTTHSSEHIRVGVYFFYITSLLSSYDYVCCLFVAAGSIWPAEALSGLVSEAVPVHGWESVAAVWPDPLHLWGGAPLQRGPELRHPASLGHHRLAAHHLHGKNYTHTHTMRMKVFSQVFF